VTKLLFGRLDSLLKNKPSFSQAKPKLSRIVDVSTAACLSWIQSRAITRESTSESHDDILEIQSFEISQHQFWIAFLQSSYARSLKHSFRLSILVDFIQDGQKKKKKEEDQGKSKKKTTEQKK
jgi:hypothetical protein